MAQADIGIQRQLDNGVLRLSFNRPERKNAITQGMYTALADALLEADAAPDVRVVVLHGSAEAFTAGNDIADFAAAPAAEGEHPSARFMRAVVQLGKPLIAAVNGPAVGIGATVLLHCDLVYAGSNATLLFPFVKLGLCPEFGSSLLLARRIGPQQAARLLLLAEPCTATQALALGLVTEVLAPAESLDRALAAAAKLAASSPDAVMSTRWLMRQSSVDETMARIGLENEHFGRLRQTPQAQAAFAAFLNKARA
ncbi:MAG: enoyl-CoA hydratase/isomerase family protein [Proteobacteria bacterium]|nr:enoyl-CoA hydratase/isomerase family protein [Pseudomonadota bacterium]MBS0495931.1 enoyl-CoA hydratase/isomerase family protein [Pseudomonadota bacterium]